MTDVRQIPLTKGKVALVDAADYERVAELEWFARCDRGRWYAIRDGDSPNRQIRLQRFILEAPPRTQVGFVNGDSLDCRRANLCMRRYLRAPQSEPYRRESLPIVEAKTRPRYAGVIRQSNGTFGACIWDGSKGRWLGTFTTDRDAALAFNVVARLLRGRDAHVNVIPPAVPLDEIEAAIASLAARLGTARSLYRCRYKKGDGGDRMNPAPERKVAFARTFATRAAARVPLHKRRRRGGRWRITSPLAAPWPSRLVDRASTAALQQARSSAGASVSIMCAAGRRGTW